MPINDKIKSLYGALKADGADVGTEQEFRNWFLEKGEQGYKNRKYVYDTFKSDGADVGNSYEEFRDWLGIGGKSASKSKGTSLSGALRQVGADASAVMRKVAQMATGGKADTDPNYARIFGGAEQYKREDKSSGKPMTMAQRQEALGAIGQMQGAEDLRQKRLENIQAQQRQPQLLGGNPSGLTLENKNVIKGAPYVNEKGEVKDSYLTQSGRRYDERVWAEQEQDAIDERVRYATNPLQAELEDAYKERDKIEKMLSERANKITQEREDRPWYLKMGDYAKSDILPDAGSDLSALEKDPEYQDLMTAARKNKELIQTLEDKRNNQMNDYWHSLGTEITNGYTFSLGGGARLQDVASQAFAMKHANSIKEKREKGEELTHDEEVAEAVLKNAEWNNRVQQEYGDQYGAWAKAGKMSATSLDFMLDFLVMGGVPLKTAKAVMAGTTKLAGNFAEKGFGKFMTKTTGAMLGTMVGGAEIANSSGLGRTMADAAKRQQGEVFENDKGEYVFGHIEEGEDGKAKLVEGGDTFWGAVLGAERDAIKENASELTGEFMTATKLLKGIGLSKIADKITAIGGKGWYQAYSNGLKTIGFNGVAGEGLEEYAGMAYDALMGGSEWKSLADLDTHIDIWLGCATMSALLNAPRMISAGHQGVQYFRYRNKNNKADRNAAEVIGETWSGLRETIDATTNENMKDVVASILQDESLTKQQKEAAMNYVSTLQKMRGYSLGLVGAQDRNDDAEATQEEKDQQIAATISDAAIAEGINAEEPKELRSIATSAAEAAQALRESNQAAADTAEQMWKDGASDAEMFSFFDGLSAEDREAAEDWYAAVKRQEGVEMGTQERIDEQTKDFQDFVDDNSADGVVTTATYQGAEVVVKSMSEDGGMATLADGSVVPLDALENVQQHDAEEVKNNNVQTTTAAVQQEREMMQKHHEKTHLPGPDEVFYLNPENPTAYRAAQQDGMWVVIPEDNPNGGQSMSEEDLLNAMDEYWDGAEAIANGEQTGNEELGVRNEELGVGNEELQDDEGEQPQQPQQPQQEYDTIQTGEGTEARIPVFINDEGERERDYEAVEPAVAYAGMVEEAGSEDAAEQAAGIVAQNIEKDIAKARKWKPDASLKSYKKIAAAIRANNEEIQALEKRHKFWSDLANYRNSLVEAAAAAEKQAKSESKKKDNKSGKKKGNKNEPEKGTIQWLEKQLGDYLNFEDYVLRVMAGGGTRVVWKDNPTTGTRGLASHTVGNIESERKKRIGILATSKKGGKYPEELAEWLWQGYKEAMDTDSDQIGQDTEDNAFNTVVGVLLRHATRGAMMAEAEARHGDAINADRGAEENYTEEDWNAEKQQIFAEQEGFATYEDYLDDIDIRNEEIALTNADMQEIYAIFAEDWQSNGIESLFTDNGNNSINSENNGEEAILDAGGTRRGTGMGEESDEGAAQGGAEESGALGEEGASVAPGSGERPDGAVRVNGRQGDSSSLDAAVEPVQGNGQAGGRRSVEIDRESIRVLLREAGAEDLTFVDRMSDEEVRQLSGLIDTWEEVNTEYGRVQEEQAKALKSRNKAERERAQSVVDAAQAAALEAFRPIEDFVRERGYIDEAEPRRTVEAGTSEGGEDVQAALAAAEQETDTNPTEAQKEAGNYKKGHIETPEEKKNEDKSKRLVSDERMEELKKRLRDKLNGRMNVGVDPEMLAIGAELAVGHIERGLTKFADYAQAMIEDLGDAIRPYLKSFYNAVRDMPEAEEYTGEMDSYDDVRQTDVARIGNENASLFDVAQEVSDERKVEQSVEEVRAEENNDENSLRDEEKEVTSQQTENEPKEFVLTLDLLEASDLDEAVKSGARAWLNGDKSPANQLSFLAAQDYVRNSIEHSERVGSNADQAQLGSGDNVTADGGNGRRDGEGRFVDTEDDGEGVSADRTGGEDSASDVASSDGTGSNRSLFDEPPVATISTSDSGSTGSGSTGRNGGNGRRKGRGGRTSVSGRPAGGQARATAKEELDAALKEFEDILKESFTAPVKGKMLAIDPVSLYTYLGAAKAIKLITAGSKVAYAAAKLGYYEFKDWFGTMKSKLGNLLREYAAMSDEQIDGFIEMMWDYDITVDGETHKVREWASLMSQEALRKQVSLSIEEKRKLQAEAEKTETIVGDLQNIRESLPFLLPKQQEDVQKAETQFYSEEHADAKHGHGKGYMFTNGTGTGKTYTGLGIVKRFLKQGKGRILIVTAQETKIRDWINDAKNLGINASMLPDTKSKGSGVVVTQYANIRQNRALLEDEFDLIVYDESHKLMENQDGLPTSTSKVHHMLSNRDERQAARRILMAGELGNTYEEAQEQLELLIQAKSLPTTKWTDEIKKAVYDDIYGNQGLAMIEERVKDLRETIERFEQNLEEQVDNLLADEEKSKGIREAVKKTKVVFLSATPFNTPANLDYTEGYIFSYTNTDEVQRETDRLRQRDNFLVDRFGSSHQRSPKTQNVSRIPQERIPDPMAASEEEVAFSDYMQTELQTMSGRDLDSEYDYSREFPKMDFPMAEMFNDAIQSLSDGRFNTLREFFDHLLDDYNTMTGYLEIFKAQMIAPRIREYIKLGKKVTLFHRRKAANTDMVAPFALAMQKANKAASEREALGPIIKTFIKTFAPLFRWEDSIDYMFPQESILREFMTEKEKENYEKAKNKWLAEHSSEIKAKQDHFMKLNLSLEDAEGEEVEDILKEIRDTKKEIDKIIKTYPKPKCALVSVFNGTETNKDRMEAVRDFNDDKGTTKVLVVQVQSGKEGISLHDTTGKYPRVQIGIFLPQSPIEFIQTEGRIFRVGNKSNAIFEYPLLGLDIELSNFAQKINGRSETTENLALGSRGRGLKDSISRSALASRSIPPENATGIGGKELDSRKAQQADGFDEAMRNYDEWRTQPKPTDYNEAEVPDPIGYMMSKWSYADNGEKVLVPYARKGTIARYIPTRSRLTAMEKRNSEFARLSALVGGSGRKLLNSEFSDHSVINKYDVVVMNTAHGAVEKKDMFGTTWSSLDVADVVKAFGHLEDSGRLVALVTANEADLDSAMKNNFRGRAVKVATITLPGYVLGSKDEMRIVIYDRVDNERLRSQVEDSQSITLSSSNENELYAQLRNVVVSPRHIDKVGKIERRLRPLITVFTNTGVLSKSKSWRTNKMEPDCSIEGGRLSVVFRRGKMAHFPADGGAYRSFGINLEEIAKNNFYYISEQAREWVKLDRFIKMSDEDLNSVYGRYLTGGKAGLGAVRDCLRAMAQSIEVALGKTPMQIRNLAEGKVENEISGSYDLAGFKEVFTSLNADNAELEALAEKVFEGVAQIDGLRFQVVPDSAFRSSAGHNVMAHYVPSRNIIELNGDMFNSIRTTDAFKAQTIVHEMIHSLTSWALDMYDNENTRGMLTEEQQEACRDIKDVYSQINNDDFRNKIRLNSRVSDNAEYGLTNEHEMMAELANPVFRAALKAKKLWSQLVNGIKMLLGIQIPGIKNEETDALTVLDKALDTLLNNFSPDVYKAYTESGKLLREVEDEALIRRLESEPKIKAYRSMQLINGRLYPPMSAVVDGELREPSELGVWEEAEERPDLADDNGYFKLDKGNKKSLKARYNPYIHSSRTMLNDQFSEAQNRENLVVVEVEIPESELTSDYTADKAKDSVGAKQWKAGMIQGQLSGTREVILSRWAKPVRIVPNEEVADNIYGQIKGQIDVMPTNVVTPQVREALEARGVKFVETDNTGKIVGGENAGKSWTSVYGKGGKLLREGDFDYVPYVPTRKLGARVRRQDDNFARRQARRARDIAEETVERLGLQDTVTIYNNIDEVPGYERLSDRERMARGWYDRRTGKIVIVLGNHLHVQTLPQDVLESVLHEAVAHYGLRRLFGDNFNQFLDNVYDAASLDIRREIDDLQERGMSRRDATEEYLASLAEDTNFERAQKSGWWQQLKMLFFDMLHKIGLPGFSGVELSDAELRYILWRSYKNLESPGEYRNRFGGVLEVAQDVSKQRKLGVGNFKGDDLPMVAESVVELSLFDEAEAIPAGEPQGTGIGEAEPRRTVDAAGAFLNANDEELLERIGETSGREQALLSDEYDRRHNDEYEAEAGRVWQMLSDDDTSFDDAAGMYANVYGQWVNGGYASAERTKLLAQLDALREWADEKEEEEESGRLLREGERTNPILRERLDAYMPAVERANNYVEYVMRKEYKLPDADEMIIVDSEQMTPEELGSFMGLDSEDIEDAREFLQNQLDNKKVKGVTNLDSGKIVIFANKLSTIGKLRRTVLHEAVHVYQTKYRGKEKLTSLLWEHRDAFPEEMTALENLYGEYEENWPIELLAHVMESSSKSHDYSRVAAVMTTAEEREALDNYINYIEYDKRRVVKETSPDGRAGEGERGVE